MKKYLTILLLFISLTSVSSSAQASVIFTVDTGSQSLPFKDDPAFNLCDFSCDLTISFPDGGTLTATDILLFEFGNDGVIDLGEGGSLNMDNQPASLDFSVGETLFLTTGESITFGVGGYINTSTGGNFKYKEIEVTTDVNIDAVLDVGSEKINLFDITATGTGDITISTGGLINVAGILASNEAGFILYGLTPGPVNPSCDVSCDLAISFPDGGTLTATEALQIFFGPGGFIDLGDTGTVNAAAQPGTLEFPSGGSFVLDPGESITFDIGGSIRTGLGGNFSYTSIEVTTDVYFDVVLDEGSALFNLYDITVTGNGVISITSDGDINGLGVFSVGEASLILNSGNAISFSDSTGATAAECTSTSVYGSTLTLTSSSSVVTADTSCIGVLSVGGSIGGTSGGTIILTDSTTTIDGTISIIEPLEDETTVIIVDDVKSESKQDGSGSIDWITLVLLSLSLIFSYRRRIFSIR